MATRFYLPSSGAAPVSPAYSAGWEKTSDATRLGTFTAKHSTSFTGVGGMAVGSDQGDTLAAQCVSEPMVAGIAFVTSDTIKGVIRGKSAGGSKRAQLVVKVVSQDGGTVRAILLDFEADDVDSWFSSSFINKKYPRAWADITIDNAYTTVAGDRLVFEIGYHQHGTDVYYTYVELGDNSASDLAENETGTDQYCPWIQISRDITFATADLACTMSGVGGLSGTLSQSYATPTEMGANEMITCLAYTDYLLVQVGATGGLGTHAGDVILSLDGNTFVKDSGGANADIIWNLPYGNFLGPAPAPWGGESIPYFITEDSFYALDFWSRKAYKVTTGLQSIKNGIFWSDSFILTDGYNVVQWIPGEPSITRRIGLSREQGFLATGTYRIEYLFGVNGGDLYAILSDGSYSWLWAYTGTAWHPLGMKTGKSYGVGGIASDEALGAIAPTQPHRFYWMFTSDLAASPNEVLQSHRISDPTGDPNPMVGIGVFQSSVLHYVTTPWIDGGFRELDGAALQLWHGGFATPTQMVFVYYALDDDDSVWYLLGAFNGQPVLDFGTPDVTGNYPGIPFRTIMFKFGLITSDPATTPNALPMTFVFRKKPELRMSYLINIDAARELAENTKTFTALMAELVAAWNLHGLVRFYYPVRNTDDTLVADGNREVDKRVDIVAMPSKEEEIRQAIRRGRISVQVMEPVAW